MYLVVFSNGLLSLYLSYIDGNVFYDFTPNLRIKREVKTPCNTANTIMMTQILTKSISFGSFIDKFHDCSSDVLPME